MAAVSLKTEGASANDSIFSLLDDSWYSHTILNYSVAFGVPAESWNTSAGVESETSLRSSEADSARETPSSAAKCSKLQSVDNHDQRTSDNSGTDLRRYSIAESEMRKVFDKFDSNGDGLISVEELYSYMKCCGTVVSEGEANSMIACVDLNNDGSVDFEEFLSLYQTYCSGDSTGEGERSREHEEQDLLEAFRVFDRNDDGLISAHELQAVLLDLGMAEGKSLIRCKAMIRTVDRDGDGHCDIREFQEMMAAQSF